MVHPEAAHGLIRSTMQAIPYHYIINTDSAQMTRQDRSLEVWPGSRIVAADAQCKCHSEGSQQPVGTGATAWDSAGRTPKGWTTPHPRDLTLEALLSGVEANLVAA